MNHLKEFENLKSASLLKDNQFIVEGIKGLKKLSRSQYKIKKLVCSNKIVDELENLEINCEDIHILEQDKMVELTGFNYHKGILALAEGPLYKDLGELKPPFLITNGITSPENMGSMMRTAKAFGFNSLIIDSKSVSPYVRRCIRVSMGNIFNLDIHKSGDLKETLEVLKSDQISIISTANSKNSINIKNWKPQKNIGLIIGSEGHGIDKEVLDLSDQIIKIPIDDSTAHLNASLACGIFLYHYSLSH